VTTPVPCSTFLDPDELIASARRIARADADIRVLVAS
jgi:hypothetical protein